MKEDWLNSRWLRKLLNCLLSCVLDLIDLSPVYSQTTNTGDVEELPYAGEVQEIFEKLNQISIIHYRKKISISSCIFKRDQQSRHF